MRQGAAGGLVLRTNPRYIYREVKTENLRDHEDRYNFWIFCHNRHGGFDELRRRG